MKIYQNKTFYEFLLENTDKIKEQTQHYDFKYHDIFDDKGKVKDFINKNKSIFEEYFAKYKELLSNSCIFKNTENGSFGTTQTKNIRDALKDKMFFEAGHKLKIANEEIDSFERLLKLINDEIDRIMNEKSLKEKFEKIEKQITNTELRAFKEAIQKDNSLLTKLKDYEEFRKEVIFSYLNKFYSDVESLIVKYNEYKPKIEEIIFKAKQEQDKWRSIVELFNSRFFVPFKIKIKNQQDVLLKAETAQFDFVFKDEQEEKQVEKEALKEVLSMGEKRALYILQILFEIEARKTENKEILLVFDDISDSFDYKNKYAIIEYLADINESGNFKSMVMTHNFDFYRTLASRVGIGRKNIFMIHKNNERKIIFNAGQYLKDIMKNFRDERNKNKKFIALIPFVRNIIEYTKDINNNEDYKKLTSCLHIKNDTENIKISDIQPIFNNQFGEEKNLDSSYFDKPIKEFIYEEAKRLYRNKNLTIYH